MKKYPISREFFPWNLFAPPISEKFLAMSVPYMKPPKSLWRDKELEVTTHEIESYDGGKITCFVMSPKKLPIGRTEKDPDKLRKVYEIGRSVAEHRIEEIKAFLQ